MEPASCHGLKSKGCNTPRQKPGKRTQWCVTIGIMIATLLVGNFLLPEQIKPKLLVFASLPGAGSLTPGFWAAQQTAGKGVVFERYWNTSSESKGRTAYVMLMHVLSPGVLDELKHLASDLDGRDVFVIYDETEHPFSELTGDKGGFFTPSAGLFGGVVVVNKQALRGISPWFKSAREHIQTLLVAFYRSVVESEPAYDHVWFLESDVRCSGDYKQTFAKAHAAADFLGRWTAGRNDNRGVAGGPWNWHRLVGVPMADRWGAFLPVMRLSRAGLRSLSDSAARDVAGFCEVYIPTLVHEGGGLMGSLPDEMLAPSGYRYRPQMTQAEYEKVRRDGATDVLYHPVLG